jgi:diguanylate cyclase (GGDEF)-like protein
MEVQLAGAIVSAPHASGRGWPAGLLAQAAAPDPVARTAGFGRWWLDRSSGALLLSLEAAQLLGQARRVHANLSSAFARVPADDLAHLKAALHAREAPADSEFRLFSNSEGLRWLRLAVLPGGAATLLQGLVSDITSLKHAAMREAFSFEATQLMIGTHTLDDAVSKMIELVCADLGWDCGMYWSIEQHGADAGRLVCSHFWSSGPSPVPDAASGRRLSIGAREGVVGAVWSSGQARWIEDLARDPEFLFRRYARDAGIHSGYAFPVAYDSDDGVHHRPGVLIFFSCMARQHTAQLPRMSAAIGALIAQTAQRMAQQESIRELAQVDGLTGLANRRHFHSLLDSACQRATQTGGTVAVLYIDLDRFKPINDGLGHATGDAVLRQFAQRLASLTPPGGEAGRVGGDEFALFIEAADAGECARQMRAVAEQVLGAARRRFLVAGRELVISASVGVSVLPDDGRQGAELLRHADSAMYRVKRSGRNSVSYAANLGAIGRAAGHAAVVEQLTVEAELLHALSGDQLFLEYQPVFDTDAGRVRAVEALVRWRRPSGEIVRPDVFIPIAEQSHLIVDIGRWVIRKACRDLALMQEAGMTALQLNVNMAAPEFLNAQLPGELAAILDAAGVEPRHVCLELTEGLMMNHAEQVIPVMRALRQRGFQISVDDFGMGYSSLSRLKDLPISSLKIDRSFVHGLPLDHQDRAIVQTIVDIGRNMRLDVIAEGVETDAQLNHLRRLGCTLVQGFLTGRPMPLEALIAAHGGHAGVMKAVKL